MAPGLDLAETAQTAAATADPLRRSTSPQRAAARVSIIVPVLNEGAHIRSLLQQLRERAPGAEVLVVDGGSTDGTVELASKLCDRVLVTGKGRAVQMNAGARAALGDIFWFVHADSIVPEDCLEQIVRTLRDPRAAGGCFRIRFPRAELIYRLSDAFGNLLVDVFRTSYGDHGIFCRRSDFFAVSEYPVVPIMEDAELYRRLGKRGRVRQLRSEILTSPRRYERVGPYRLTAAFIVISVFWFLRVPNPWLARIYKQLCVPSDVPSGVTASV